MEIRLEKLVIKLSRPAPMSGNRDILVVAPGAGSVGDQAMFEAFAYNTDGSLTVICRNENDLLRVPDLAGRSVTVLALDKLLYGTLLPHLIQFWQLARIMRQSRSISVVGADIMDGVYSPIASERRFRLAEAGSKLGLQARILGFSWNKAPHPRTLEAMRSASKSVQLLARDPGSSERLRRDGATNVSDVADLAFLVPPEELSDTGLRDWMGERASSGRRVVILNANYLLESHFDQVAVYSRFVADGIASGHSFVLLPHDSRTTNSDTDLLRRIAEIVDNEDVYLVNDILTPGEVISAAGLASFAVTGRMHLAILCANAGTPSIAMSYQGKIEGLYRRLGMSCWIDPGPQISEDLRRVADELESNLERESARLVAALPATVELSRLNVTNLN